MRVEQFELRVASCELRDGSARCELEMRVASCDLALVTPCDLIYPDVQGNLEILCDPCDLIDPDGHSDIIHATLSPYVTLLTDVCVCVCACVFVWK
jgi:hypothetical protein